MMDLHTIHSLAKCGGDGDGGGKKEKGKTDENL